MALLEFGAVLVASIWVFLIADLAEKSKTKSFTTTAFTVFVLVEIGAEQAVLALVGVV